MLRKAQTDPKTMLTILVLALAAVALIIWIVRH
jgi:hypothetical protein